MEEGSIQIFYKMFKRRNLYTELIKVGSTGSAVPRFLRFKFVGTKKGLLIGSNKKHCGHLFIFIRPGVAGADL